MAFFWLTYRAAKPQIYSYMKGRPALRSKHLLPAWCNQQAALDLVDVGLTTRPRAAYSTGLLCGKAVRYSRATKSGMFMWRASGARRWGSRGMASLIESDVSAFAILIRSVPKTQHINTFIIARE